MASASPPKPADDLQHLLDEFEAGIAAAPEPSPVAPPAVETPASSPPLLEFFDREKLKFAPPPPDALAEAREAADRKRLADLERREREAEEALKFRHDADRALASVRNVTHTEPPPPTLNATAVLGNGWSSPGMNAKAWAAQKADIARRGGRST